MELNQNQKDAIYNHTHPILVSASAGSGKTFAMVERALSILANGEANIRELLIVTFTNASALEMKQRLYDGLKNSDNENLKNQLDDFSVADISSIDSFCQKVIKKYFFEINVSPNFSVIDEVESKFLKNNALTKTFQSLQKEKNGDFKLIVDSLAKKRNLHALSEHILEVSNYANTLPDKDYFYKNLALSAYNEDLENNFCFNYLIQKFDKFILNSISNLEELRFEAVGDESIFNQYIDEASKALNEFLKLFPMAQIASFNTLVNFSHMPDKRHFKLQSQKDFQDRLLKIFSSIREISQKYDGYFEGGNIRKIQENLAKIKKIAESFINIVILFEKNYEKLKQEKFLLDFADLERKTLEILKNEEILESISKNYKFVFIDEFQDTNLLQFSILQKISKYAIPFYVGDPKQSIYAFRNSTPEILLDTLSDYKANPKDKKAINFVENFRSDKSILDFVNFIFSQIMTIESVDIDYVNDGEFNTQNNKTFLNPDIHNVTIGIVNKIDEKEKIIKNEVYSVLKDQKNIKNKQNFTDYTDLIAWYIKSFFDKKVEIFDKNLDRNRKVCFSDFVILLRNRSSFEKLEAKLSQYGFPVSTNLKINLLDCLEVQILHNFLTVLSNSFDDYSFTNFLLSPIGGLNETDLIQIRIKFSKEEYFYSACYKYLGLGVDDIITSKLKKCFECLEEYRVRIQVQPISDILNAVINEFNLENLWFSLKAGKDRINKVRLFINILQNKSFNHSLSDYLNFTNLYKNAFDVNYSTTSSDDCITLMTIHNSKGLEFPITIIGDAGKGFVLTDNQDIMIHSNLGVVMDMYNVDERVKTQSFIKNAIIEYKKDSELKEEMRLLYVALTRAKYFLGIFGDYNLDSYSNDALNKIKKPRTYLDWLIGASLNRISLQSRDPQLIIQNAVLQIFDSEKDGDDNIPQDVKIVSKQEDKKLIEKLKNNYTYIYPYKDSTSVNIKNSVSKLLSSINAEQEIKNERESFLTFLNYNNSLEEASKRGIAYHKVMEQLDFKDYNFSQQLEKIKFNLPSQMVELIDFDLIKECFGNIKNMINSQSKIYKEHKFMLYIPYNSIFKMSHITDKILVQGIIDIFIENDDKIILIDYKTNGIKNEQKLVEKYQLQLNLYKMALEIQYKKPVDAFIYSFSASKLIKL